MGIWVQLYFTISSVCFLEFRDVEMLRIGDSFVCAYSIFYFSYLKSTMVWVCCARHIHRLRVNKRADMIELLLERGVRFELLFYFLA